MRRILSLPLLLLVFTSTAQNTLYFMEYVRQNNVLLFNNIFYSTGSSAFTTFSTSVSYTAGYKFNNLGLGLRLRFLPGTDLYFVTDNIIQVFNYKKAHRLTAAFGINIAVGTKQNKLKEETI